MKTRLDRRTMLRGMLGGAAVAIGLPALEIFLNDTGTAYAGGGGFPTRFGTFFFGNGVLPTRWTPSGGSGPLTTLSPQLSLLESVKAHCTVVSGMRVLASNTTPHGSGPAGLLSGSDVVDGAWVATTIDQRIAQEVGGTTRFRSLQVGVQRSTNSVSMSGPRLMNPTESDPLALFERIFGAGFRLPGETTEVDPRIGLRRSVLDAVSDQTRRLQSRVGTADRTRLEEHLHSIRDLERQLAALEEDPPVLDACSRPMMPGDFPDIEGRPQLAAKSRAICDLLVMAMACDQTRVFLDMFSQSVNNMLFLDTDAGHHQLTHDEVGDQPNVDRIVTFIVGEFAYLIERMRQVQEGSGTLLDHSAVLLTTDCSYCRTHALDEYPLVIAGTANGALRQGLHITAPGENASKLMLSLLRACGVASASYGVGPALAREGLGAIEV
jgi:hypothetical protein